MSQSVVQTLRSASAPATALDSLAPASRTERRPIRAVGFSAFPLRIGLIVACALSVSAAWHVGDPTSYLQTDIALAHLLRGMAVIKSTIVLAAMGAVWWRLGWVVSRPVALVYIAGSAALAGSTMLIWQLSLMPLAALVFHGAGLGMLIVGWRER